LTSPYYAKPGNGLLLFFWVDNFDVALPRARALVSRLEEEPHVNPNTGTAEFSLRDPDGHYVTISALNAASPLHRASATRKARADSAASSGTRIPNCVLVFAAPWAEEEKETRRGRYYCSPAQASVHIHGVPTGAA